MQAFGDFLKINKSETDTFINLIPVNTSDAFGYSNCDIPLTYDEIINKNIMNPLCSQ